MENARMRPSFAQGFKVSVWVFIVISLLVALTINGVETSRAEFVKHHAQETCTISEKKFYTGRSSTFTWSLECPSVQYKRSLDVSEYEYESSKVGQEIPIYYSTKLTNVWERFEPTNQWFDERRTYEWGIFLGVAFLIALLYRAVWNEAKKEVERLNSATIADAEIIGIEASDSRGTSTQVKLRFLAKGQMFEGKFPTTAKQLGDHFEKRTVQVAVNEDNPSESRILSMFTLAELIPKK